MRLAIAQIIVSVILIAFILIQEREAGTSGLFGGTGSDGGFYQQRRGLERVVFFGTIVLLVIFAALALLNFVF